MKLLNLAEQSAIYTSNVYLLMGDWNTLDDVTTLVDVGRDPTTLVNLEAINTGVGKRKLDQVVLTHSHYDHVELLPELIERYHPRVYGLASAMPGLDRVLQNGEILRAADGTLEVIFTPGHSSDSVCLYSPEMGWLFAGDAPLIIRSADASYDAGFIEALRILARKRITSIFFGHGAPMTMGCQEALAESLQLVGG